MNIGALGIYVQVFGWMCVFIFLGYGPRSGIAGSRQWHPTPVLLPGKSHGWRSLVGCNPWDREESDTTERLHFHFSLSCIGEGNGNPLQCSCLENPRDRGAWWASICGVAQSRTWLKRLSSGSSSSSRMTLCLTFWGTAKLFPTAAAPSYTPASSIWGFSTSLRMLLTVIFSIMALLVGGQYPWFGITPYPGLGCIHSALKRKHTVFLRQASGLGSSTPTLTCSCGVGFRG